MSGLKRITLFFLGTLFALAATALLVVNLYVQSQGTQARIQQELSQRLGTPLHIRGVSVTPWGGLALTGITIPQVSTATSRDFLEAKSFHLHIRLLSLFSQRLVIKEISLSGLNVVWPQDQDGKWKLPGAHGGAREAPLPNEQNGRESETPVAAATPGSTPSAPVTSAPGPESSPGHERNANHLEIGFVPEIRRVSVNDGNFQFLDETGAMVASFDSVRFRSIVRNSQAIRGTASIAKISVRDRVFLQTAQSPLHYGPESLELPKISARLGGGDATGRFKLQPQSEDSPFEASVSFRGVEADQIVTQAGGPAGVIQGKLEGSFEATGKTADASALNGKGEIVLRDGKLQQYSLLVALGQILQIEELTQLQLQQAEAKYHVNPGVVTIDELILRSPNTRLSAKGTIGFNGRLRLDSQLAINDKIRGQLFKPIRDNFQPIEEPGYYSVKFEVNGTIGRPKTNLMEKVVGRDLKDFVSGLLGTKPDRKKKKKSKETENAPAAQSTATPAEENTDTRPSASATPP